MGLHEFHRIPELEARGLYWIARIR